VPAGVVAVLKAREDAEGFVRMDARPSFVPGEKVRVLAGAFMDNAGLFSGIADHDRVCILLNMLGRQVRVLLDADVVAAA
jgi:transcriptional antiterminator RfaH